MTVQFRLLGDVEAHVHGQPIAIGYAQLRCVLAVLLVEANHAVSVDQLVDRVWGDRRLPRNPRAAVQHSMTLLRNALAPAAGVTITWKPAGYRLTVEPEMVDLHRFHRLVEDGRAADDDRQAAALFEQALELWCGEPFAGLTTTWLESLRATLARHRDAARLDLTDVRLRRGLHAALLPDLSAWAAKNPLDERLACQLMLALYRSGRPAEALGHYQQMRSRLADELGTDPSAPLRRLHEQILAADPALTAPTVRLVPQTAATAVPRQLPARPRSFTGRTRELADLDTALAPEDAQDTVVSAIGGTGGTGKTWLALHWAYQNLDRFPDGQLYVDLRGFDPTGQSMSAATAVRGFLDALGVTPAAVPLDMNAQVELYRSLVAGKRMLIFLDNAADSAQVAPLLPGSPTCVVLITSRLHLSDLIAAHGARSLNLGVNQLPGDVFGFTGRQAELTELGRVLGAEQTGVPIVVVCGTAGVGKTALALHWAHRIRSNFPDGQLYVDLRGYDSRLPVTAEDALSRLLDGLGVTGADVPVDPDQRAARYRAELADRRVLIVLDNASTVDQVRPLLPGTSGCLVLVTSRNSLAGLVALHGAHRLDVDLLPAPDSLALLRTLIGERVRREPAAAAELAAQCGRLPLALRVAAELAASRPASALAELTGELADRRRRLRMLDVGDDVRAAVRTVFSWSYLQLPPQVAKAFRRLGLHSGPDVTPFALAALTGSDPDESRRTLEVLARNHLVQPVPAGRFVVHDLLRAYAEELAGEHDPASERSAAVERLLAHHLATASAAMDLLYPADRPYRPDVSVTLSPPFPAADAARAWLDAERSTLVALCRFAERDDRPGYAVDLANTLYRYLEGGHYADASTIHECALRAAQRAGEDGMLAAALTNLGALRRLLGDYDQAAKHLHEAIELHRRTGDQYGAARALSNLGIVQERLGEYEEAASLHLEALALHQRLGSRYGEAAALLNLGNAHSRPGHHAGAVEYLERALDLFRRLDDAIGQASALSNLGAVCASLRRYPDAVRHLSRAQELFQRLDHSYGVASTLSNLGNVYTRLGDWSQAHHCYTSALEMFRDIGHRYGEAAALNGLGETLRIADRPGEARAAHTSALRIATETGDQDEQDRARAGLGAAHQHA